MKGEALYELLLRIIEAELPPISTETCTGITTLAMTTARAAVVGSSSRT
ncbi:hypothetical protein METHB2_660003 [Candidatus Methylobacter favarea]|uniref:Uncharacterized protein n=1 Tax=Candidatus Methylobacter favarea TaxID=2707345 RepID=A0A8S0XKV6_9GAMM|nr:hypothetical protein METHB2_660003 [Candidatus Methylobacter favarea]